MSVNVDLPRYTITPSMAGPGSITPNAQFEVRGGQTKTVFFSPNQYCHVVSVTTDGVAQSNAVNLRSQTFTNIRADHSVHVAFANDTFKVHYDPNGASNPNQQTGEFTQNTVTGTMADSNYTVGVTGSLRTNAFVREGYTFKGWNTNANGTGVFLSGWICICGYEFLYNAWCNNYVVCTVGEEAWYRNN